jgi:hypothetical protein
MRAAVWMLVVSAGFIPCSAESRAEKRVAASERLSGRVEATCIDAVTGKPALSLYVTAEPIDRPLPPGQFPFRLDSVDGTRNGFVSKPLAPGRYQLWAAHSASNPENERLESERPVVVDIRPGETSCVVIRVSGRSLTEQEIDERWPWQVYGRVVDPSGSPIAGAVVRAHCGFGSIPCTGATLADAQGNYRLHFANGGFILEKRAIYYASISAAKPGMFETNLNRQGDLAAAEPGAEYGGELFRRDQLIYQHQPRRVDFVMDVAAELAVRVRTDRERDEKLERMHVSLKGKLMPPGCSVVDSGPADRWGSIEFQAVPRGHEWYLEIEVDGETVRSQPFRLSEPQRYAIDLDWRRDATGIEVLDIASIKDALDRDQTLALIGNDPLSHSPAAASEQEEAREWLRRIGEANRDWLRAPSDEVGEYAYDFVMNDKPAHRYVVPRDRQVAGVVLQGIAFVSAAKWLIEKPENVVVRQIDRDEDRVTVSYSLLEAGHLSAGNGVLGSYHGFFSKGFRDGVIVFDPRTYQLLECRTHDVTEKFGDYCSLAAGRFVPGTIEITKGDEVRNHWKFAVYEPGLWLFDKSVPPSDDALARSVRVTNVSIRGESAKRMRVAIEPSGKMKSNR